MLINLQETTILKDEIKHQNGIIQRLAHVNLHFIGDLFILGYFKNNHELLAEVNNELNVSFIQISNGRSGT